MIGARELFLENPELRRNFRIELSPKRVITAGIITAVFALIVLPSLLSANRPGPANTYLMVILWSQKITLALGGAFSCWHAVRRERDQNTYDYQRITRLSPLELAIGKLFGAPALAYFVTLCLVPPAMFSAATSNTMGLAFVLRDYVLLFTGSLVIHCFALMFSTVADKGGAFGGLFLLALLQLVPAMGWLAFINTNTPARGAGMPAGVTFYGFTFPATFLWAVLQLGFAAWFLLAVVRNIKVGLEAVQLFTLPQGIGFAAYCNFVWIGFFPWSGPFAVNSRAPLLLLSVMFFYFIGIGVLHSREWLRRKLREAGNAMLQGGLLVPVGLLALGAVAAEVVIVMLAAAHNRAVEVPGNGNHDFLLVVYLAAWLMRDLLYLQWMKVRPVRSSLRKALLYLAVFYIAASILFRASLVSMGAEAGFAAWIVPFPVLRASTPVQWQAASGMWLLAPLAQLAAAAAFAYLYHQQVSRLAPRPQATAQLSAAS